MIFTENPIIMEYVRESTVWMPQPDQDGMTKGLHSKHNAMFLQIGACVCHLTFNFPFLSAFINRIR